MLGLPLPCRYDDLTLNACRGEIPSIALFVDVPSDAVPSTLAHWREVLPVTHLNLLAASFNRDQVGVFLNSDGNATLAAVIAENFVDEDAVKQIDSLVWASCAPYDASGVYVKTDIERSLVSALRSTKGVFLVHDPAYKIIRQFDGAGLQDRVVYRAWRKKIYRGILKAVIGAAWVAARLSGKPNR
jgi:hypothetical protein